MESPRAATGLMGRLIVVTIIVGILDVGFTAYSYMDSYYPEQYYLAIITVGLVLSIVLFLTSMCNGVVLRESKGLNLCGVYHWAMAVLIFVGAVLMSVQTHNYIPKKLVLVDRDDVLYSCRIVSCVLGFVNSIMYANIGAQSTHSIA